MPTYPTPFLGGSDPPDSDRESQRDLAEPFSPEAEEEARAAEELEGGAEDQPGSSALEAETALPTSDSEAGEEPESEDSSEFAVAMTVTEEIGESESPDAGARQGAGEEYPDFLLGSDSTESDGSSEGLTQASAPAAELASALESVEKARELLDGPLGDRMRRLIAELSENPTAEALSQAFAAGYLAAKSEEDD